MINITTPSNHIEERNYVIKTVFDSFLGLEYDLKYEATNSTILSWDNKSISFRETFWDNGGTCYQNLPKVIYLNNRFIVEDTIPVLYGDDFLQIENNHIDCGIDVFSSIFFMLTRWEESVVTNRDKHNRFIGKESIAFKAGFLHRPIVNEYIEMVWNMLLFLGFKEKRKERRFEIVPTHDVDMPYMKDRFLKISKDIIKRILSRNNESIPLLFHYYFKDPYNTFNFLMKVSEGLGVKSHFYLMSSDMNISEYKNSPYITSRYQRILNGIRKRGHILGFHPGYFSVCNEECWRKEKENVGKYFGIVPDEGRQHYLKFNIPQTFSFWENNGMRLDSTLSYHDVEGFRCGTGDVFPVFNFLEKKEYNLKERPLIIMDCTLVDYQSYPIEKIPDILNYYISASRKYKMPLTLLFHNSYFVGKTGEKLRYIYKSVLSKNNVYGSKD